MAQGASMYINVSMFFRTKKKTIAEDFSIELLQWLQVNWLIDQYSIWFSYSCQCRGQDINRGAKVLSWLKNNLKKTATGSIDFPDTDPDYMITTFVEHDSRLESQADDIGLGIAIMQETLTDLSVKKEPRRRDHQVRAGQVDPLLHPPQACSDAKTLTAAEEAIVALLMKKKALRTANEDLTKWVYPPERQREHHDEPRAPVGSQGVLGHRH